MKYAFICRDGGDKTQIRNDLVKDHLAYVETVIDKMVIAGPCPPTDPNDSRQFEGSIVVYEADSPEEARALFDNDPYAKAGVWDSVDMLAFNPVAGTYVGGKTW